jgi:hypothetical protein
MTNWPKHPDGRPKKIGEMTPEEQRRHVKAACKRLEAEFARPDVQEKIAAILHGDHVDN